MKRLIYSFHPPIARVCIVALAIAIVGYLMVRPRSQSAARATATMMTFTVNSTLDATDANPGDGICDDGASHCTLRAAINESNFSGGANTINVPAGTYTLTGPFDDEFNGLGATLETGDLDIVDLSAFSLPRLTSVTIVGAGAGSTIIDGGGVDRVLDVNNFVAVGSSVDVTLRDLTIRNGHAKSSGGFNESGGAIHFDGFDNNTFEPTGTLTITNCNITSNTAAGQAGGVLAIFGSLIMTGSQVSGNTAVTGAGGGISYDGSSSSGLRTLQVTNSTISSNHANEGTFGNGGGIWAGGNANKTVNYNSISGNSAGAQGGGLFNGSGSLTMNFNVIVGNSAAGNAGSTGLRNNIGSIDANNNWWGCNAGPSNNQCDRASNVTSIGAWLKLSHTATPNSIVINQSTTLQADFFTNNLGTGIAPADLVALNGRTVTFNNATLGSISGANPSINAGKANATFTAGGVGGNGSADATVDSATVTANISISEPATVTTNPTNQSACDGGSVSFTASGSGFPAPTVQWQVSTGGPFSDISGATSTTLTFTATAANNGNQYRAVFTNAGGSATTTAATLTVNTAPTVATNPTNQTECEGQTATFTAAANGSPAPTVQWQVSTGGPFANISGATSTTLSFTVNASQNGNQYRAVFTNSCGTATTTAATLTVKQNTSATDLTNQTVCQGATANFSTTASGTGPFTYAWTVDGSPFGGNTSSISVDTTAVSAGNHSVSVTVTGACNSATKNATLTVQAPTATTDPADVMVCNSAPANFSTTASGTGPFHYAWTLDGSPFNGDSSSITVPTGSLSQGVHTVSVTTTGSCGSASQSATLSVNNTPPAITVTTSNISVWPPNHQYQSFTPADFGVAASSGCDGNLTNSVVISKVSSDELEDNPTGADGATLADIAIAPDCKSVQLRRERDGNLNGRVYTITFKVTDSVGQTATVNVTVSVPLNQSGSPAVNDGPAGGYTVNSSCP